MLKPTVGFAILQIIALLAACAEGQLWHAPHMATRKLTLCSPSHKRNNLHPKVNGINKATEETDVPNGGTFSNRQLQAAWTQRGADIDAEAAGDSFGCSVALSSNGNILAIGAEGNDGNGSSSGHVRAVSYTHLTLPTNREV